MAPSVCNTSPSSRRDGAGALSPGSRQRQNMTDMRTSRLPPDISHLLAFTDAPGILRGSQLPVVMRRGAVIFENVAASSDTYKLSEPVEELDLFLSHNWDIPRFWKFFALAVHFNFGLAIATTLVVWLVVCVVLALNKVPCVHAIRGETHVIWGQALCAPAFIVALFFGRGVLWRCGVGGPYVFLDKTCVHQTDVRLKMIGLQKLGAFIRCSKHMVVLFSGLYLRKLWTVFEVAAFLSLHPQDQMIVLPLAKSRLFLIAVCLAYVYQLLAVILDASGMRLISGFSTQMFSFVFGIGWAWSARRWLKEKQGMLEYTAHFAVRLCSCTDEGDRLVVYTNIAKLMRACGAVVDGASDDEALNAFDQLVRSEVFERLLAGAGRRNMTYKQYVFIGFVIAGAYISDWVVHGFSGGSARKSWVWVLAYVQWVVAGVPLILIALEDAASKCLQLGPWSERLWVVATASSVAATGVCVVYAEDRVALLAETSDVAFAAFVAVIFLLAGLARWLCIECDSAPSSTFSSGSSPVTVACDPSDLYAISEAHGQVELAEQ